MVLDLCLSPRRGRSIRVRLVECRGDCGCNESSDSEEDDEALENAGESVGRVG